MAHRNSPDVETQMLAELPGPSPSGHDYPLGPDSPCCGLDRPDRAVSEFDASNRGECTDGDPTITGCSSIRRCHRAWLHVAITRHEQDAFGLWHCEGGHEGFGLLRRQPFDRVMQRAGGLHTCHKACQVWLCEDNTEVA